MKKIYLILALIIGSIACCNAQQTILYKYEYYYINDVKYKMSDPVWAYFTFVNDYSIVYESDKYGNAKNGNVVPLKYIGATGDYFIYKTEQGSRLFVIHETYHVSKDLEVINTMLLGCDMISVYVRSSEAERKESVPQLRR